MAEHMLTDEQIDEYISMDSELIAGEGYDDPVPQWTQYQIYVNLSLCPNGLYLVQVYDGDIGGPSNYWVTEVYDGLDEARAAYDGRCKEVEDETPGYVCNVWCTCHHPEDCPLEAYKRRVAAGEDPDEDC